MSIDTQNTVDNNEIDLIELFETVFSHKWFIIIITLIFALCGVGYTLFSTPIYQTEALIQVEKNQNNPLLGDLSSVFSASQSNTSTEIELIKSRMVLGKTINDFNLTTQAMPKYMPIIGKGLARLRGNHPPELSFSRFEVTDDFIQKPFLLTVKNDTNFTISYDDKIVSGKTGTLINNKDFSLLISSISAPADTQFILSKEPFLTTFNAVLKNFSVSDKGKDTGVLQLLYTGDDPILIKKILNSISNNYLLQNVERRSEEAGRSLEFLNGQLPEIRMALNDAENKLNQFRQQNDSVDLSLEAKSVLDRMVSIEAGIKELAFQETEISKLYTKEHPAYKTLIEKKAKLQKVKDEIGASVTNMPKVQQEILRLTRDVQSTQAIYMQLLNKQQELQVNKASTIGNVRIIDSALTLPDPIKPKKTLIVTIATLLGLFASIGWILVRRFFNSGIKKVDELEKEGINVYALIPLSTWLQNNTPKDIRKKNRQKQLLSLANPVDPAIESIRSLRTSLHFIMMNVKNNVLMISGASPAVGKSFISTNLACVIAQSDKKVLLIDGDMRKGYLHEIFNIHSSQKGLSDILSNNATLPEVIYKIKQLDNFDIIVRGQVPPNPSELLMSENFNQLIKWATENYDLVVIDTPPILPVTDATIIGQLVGCTMLIARFGISTAKEIKTSIVRLEQSGIKAKGVILNAVQSTSSEYKYSYYSYSEKKTK